MEQVERKRRPQRKTAQSTENKAKTSMQSPDKMVLLFTIVNREKSDFYVDLLEGYEINMQMVLSASGTADINTLNLLGLTSSEKSVIISAVRKDKANEALAALEQKFNTTRGGKGIAYTVPMSSVIGVAIYQFLSNKKSGGVL